MAAKASGFGRLWTAVVASNLGDGLVLAAFPLLAASLTRNPVAVAGLSVAAGLPWLVFGPISGAVVDRFDRRKLMWAFDLGRATVVGALAAFVFLGGESLQLLYLVVFLIATGETIVDTAAQAVLPRLVPPDGLDRANGKLFSTQTVAHRFVGPPLGGFLFGVAATLPVVADAASFAIAALVITSLRGEFRPDPDATVAPSGLWVSTLEGLSWLWQDKPIRAFALGAAILNIGIVAGESILVLLAQDDLKLSGPGFGALIAATAAGYTIGAAIAPWLVERAARLTVVVASVVMIATASAAIALAPHWSLAAGGLGAIGIASGLWDVIAVSYRQSVVPDRLLGRIMAAYRFVAYGAYPIGALLGGVSARAAGNRAPFAIGAVVVFALVPYLIYSLRSVDLSPVHLRS